MGQFLRFAAIIVLLFVGFGSGLCGVLGFGYSAVQAVQGRWKTDDFVGVAIGLACVGVVIAVACFFAIRALMRRIRAHGARPATPPPA